MEDQQREMRERQQEAYHVREKDRAAFVVVNLFPSHGHRFKFFYTPSILETQGDMLKWVPDAIMVREYPCNPENEEFVMCRVRNTPGVVMHTRTIGDVQSPMEVMRKIDELARKNDLRYKIDH